MDLTYSSNQTWKKTEDIKEYLLFCGRDMVMPIFSCRSRRPCRLQTMRRFVIRPLFRTRVTMSSRDPPGRVSVREQIRRPLIAKGIRNWQHGSNGRTKVWPWEGFDLVHLN